MTTNNFLASSQNEVFCFIQFTPLSEKTGCWCRLSGNHCVFYDVLAHRAIHDILLLTEVRANNRLMKNTKKKNIQLYCVHMIHTSVNWFGIRLRNMRRWPLPTWAHYMRCDRVCVSATIFVCSSNDRVARMWTENHLNRMRCACFQTRRSLIFGARTFTQQERST